ncbi:MAG TPA: ATP-dependent DNA helicase [Candidatus Poseidoniales archaeon]|nr:MAG TPA: ATP-dependent DNA helicase [Candidatus Poseidoniales archaeon]|tara:strand:+ start:13200 stop:15317 length:2118 start_codon:yes stop_codon:yes gene_type:complete
MCAMNEQRVEVDSSTYPFLAHAKPRPGQLEMIQDGILALAKGGFHLAAAPTGIGKTAASLAAALEVAGRSSQKKTVFFLTSRQTQHRIVVDTVRRINERRKGSMPVRLVDMVGQAGMCVQPFAKESPLVFSLLCSQARKTRSCKPWITSAPGLKERILATPLHVDELVDISRTHTVHGEPAQTCPWKAAREAVSDADVFVGDYNHLFDDGVRESSLKAMDLSLEDIIIVVDEAHNLPDRIRMTLEKRLTRTMIRNTQMELEEYAGVLAEAMKAPGGDVFSFSHGLAAWAFDVVKASRGGFDALFNGYMRNLSGQDEEAEVAVDDVLNVFHRACDTVDGKAGQQQLQASSSPHPEVDVAVRIHQLRDVLQSVDVDMEAGDDGNPMEPNAHKVAEILDCLLKFGSTPALTMIYDTKGKDGRITTHLLDPGLVSKPVFEQSAGALLMSGTLYPPSMYANILALPQTRTTSVAYASPFAAMRRPVVVAKNVTTKYTERSLANTLALREHVQALIDASPGNVAVFAPSYAMLNEVILEGHFRGARLMAESRDWTKGDLDQIVDTLLEEKRNGRKILLAGVFGARLSEGVDYHSGALDAVACIGIPNSPPSVLSKSLKTYAEERFGRNLAWRYTVSQPAVNAILQAMGRPIRSIGDRALIVLLDRRVTDRTYSGCFPSDLRMNDSSDADSTRRFARRFFAKVHPDRTVDTD